MAEALIPSTSSDSICINEAYDEYRCLKEGDAFSSLVDLEKAIKDYEEHEHCNLFKFNTRSIEGARKKGLKRYLNPVLKYASLNYMCVHGGQYESRSKGLRPNQSTFRTKCPVIIAVRPDETGEKLVVKSFVNEHNHVRSKAIFNHYPRQRRLDTDAKSIASKLISMKDCKSFTIESTCCELNYLDESLNDNDPINYNGDNINARSIASSTNEVIGQINEVTTNFNIEESTSHNIQSKGSSKIIRKSNIDVTAQLLEEQPENTRPSQEEDEDLPFMKYLSSLLKDVNKKKRRKLQQELIAKVLAEIDDD